MIPVTYASITAAAGGVWLIVSFFKSKRPKAGLAMGIPMFAIAAAVFIFYPLADVLLCSLVALIFAIVIASSFLMFFRRE